MIDFFILLLSTPPTFAIYTTTTHHFLNVAAVSSLQELGNMQLLAMYPGNRH